MMTDTPKYKILSSSSLKIIAMLSMLIDHASTHLQGTCYVSHTQSLRSLNERLRLQ